MAYGNIVIIVTQCVSEAGAASCGGHATSPLAFPFAASGMVATLWSTQIECQLRLPAIAPASAGLATLSAGVSESISCGVQWRGRLRFRGR